MKPSFCNDKAGSKITPAFIYFAQNARSAKLFGVFASKFTFEPLKTKFFLIFIRIQYLPIYDAAISMTHMKILY